MTPTEHPRILAIILNWERPAVTQECVQALQAMRYPKLDILIVDNGSKDDSVATLQAHFPQHMLLEMAENGGFAVGNNAALQMALQAGYDYALLINNDAFAAADMLTCLIKEAEPNIGLLSPKIFYEAQPNRIWFGNGRQHPLTLDLRDSGRGQLDAPQWANSKDVDYLLGTCLLANLSAVRQVGLFDRRFFMYFEDLDWSLRMRQAGYRLRLVADAHLYHRIAVSSGGEIDSPLRRYHLAKSSVIFWHKHLHKGNPPAIILFRLGSAIKMVGRLLVTGQRETAVAYLSGLWDGWKARK